MVQFDASIDLSTRMLPARMASEDAVARVRAMVEAVLGANWVSVEWSGPTPTSLEWVRVFAPGDAKERHEREFGQVRWWVEALIRAFLYPRDHPS